jgi:DNA-binding protein HU-beta
MSKAFIADVLQRETGVSGVAANRVAGALLDAIVGEIKRRRRFTLPSFGSFRVCVTPARKALNPKTLTPIKVKKGKTVRFKASPVLKKTV